MGSDDEGGGEGTGGGGVEMVKAMNRSVLCMCSLSQMLLLAGWRIRKHFFLMANRKNSKAKKLLSWVSKAVVSE